MIYLPVTTWPHTYSAALGLALAALPRQCEVAPRWARHDNLLNCTGIRFWGGASSKGV